MDDDQIPWLRLALCPQTPTALLRELLCSPSESRQHINQALADWFAHTERQPSPSANPPHTSRYLQRSLNLPEEFNATATWRTLRKALHSLQTSKAVEKVLSWQSARPRRHVLTPAHPDWPPQMHTLPDPPAVLYVIGEPSLLAMDQVAMVGARKSTLDGRKAAFEIASQLAEHHWVITSGLAQGIDTEAHEGCLAGGSATVAVMATDANQIYPKANRHLAERILDNQGCLITETPLGSPLRRYCFPRRNRLISALSKGVVVVEAAIKSGTITTAKHAADQGREVMAVPGSIRNPNVSGCHQLIRDGAALVTSACDVMHNLELCQNHPTRNLARKKLADAAQSGTICLPVAANHGTDSEQVTTLLEAMGYDAAPLERLVEHTGWGAATLVTLLTQLELQGLVSRDSAGRYSRC